MKSGLKRYLWLILYYLFDILQCGMKIIIANVDWVNGSGQKEI